MSEYSRSDEEHCSIIMMMYNSGANPDEHTKREAMRIVMNKSKGCIHPAHADMILTEYGFTDADPRVEELEAEVLMLTRKLKGMTTKYNKLKRLVNSSIVERIY